MNVDEHRGDKQAQAGSCAAQLGVSAQAIGEDRISTRPSSPAATSAAGADLFGLNVAVAEPCATVVSYLVLEPYR